MSTNGNTLPNVKISPRGLAELEAWLRRKAAADQPDQWYYVHPLAPAARPADYLVRDPHPDFQGSWVNSSSSDFATAFGVSRIGRQKKLWLKLAVTGEEGATDSLIFTLPPTFRPAKTHRMIVRQGTKNYASIDVNPDGTVVYVQQGLSETTFEEFGALHWGVNNDTGASGLTLNADGNVFVNAASNALDFAGGLSTFVAAAFDMDLTGSYRLGVDGSITIEGTGTDDISVLGSGAGVVTVNGQGGVVTVMTVGNDVIVKIDGNVTVKLNNSTGQIEFLDSADAPFVQFDQVTGDIHRKAGSSDVFDL